MVYYKVKPEFDNVVISKNFDFLVGNELYTGKEIQKLEKMYANRRNYSKVKKELDEKERVKFSSMFDLVEVSKRDIYWSFGARFEKRVRTED